MDGAAAVEAVLAQRFGRKATETSAPQEPGWDAGRVDGGGRSRQSLSAAEIRELARVFCKEGSARRVLAEAGFVAAQQPAWTSAEQFWHEVSSELGNGKVLNGQARLMKAAFLDYQGNEIFAGRVAGLPHTHGPSSSDRPRERSDAHGLAATPEWLMLDREDGRRELQARLTSGAGGIVVVHGEPGVGKSTLVDAVLADLAWPGGLRVHRHEALPSIPVDVRTLTDDLGGTASRADAAGFGNSSIARFEAALGALGDQPVTIVVEHAENLMHGSDNKLTDLDLDEAFEVLASDDQHQVTVVLITSVPLESSQKSAWPRKAHLVAVRGLPRRFFFRHLEKLDHRGQSGLAALPVLLAERFFRALGGNPKDAEVAHDLLANTNYPIDACTLVENVARLPTKNVSRWLADQYVCNVAQINRRVLDALVAFATPVGVDALAAVLAGELSEADVRAVLRRLVASRIVRRSNDEQYFLPSSELERMLTRALRHGRSALFRDAAGELLRRRPKSPANVAELRFQFAAVDALLRCGHVASAHEVLGQIDGLLSEWNRTGLLLAQREAMQGRIGDEHEEMINDNALGEIYKSKGEVDSASAAFSRAMIHAERRKDRASQTKLRANLAAMYWQSGDAERAYLYYGRAREEAQRDDQPLAEMGALEGLADCLRRWGQYNEAIRRAEEALAVYARSERLRLGTQQSRALHRAFRCKVKLARWYSELGRHVLAAGYLAEAKSLEVRRDDQPTTGAYLDARADILLSEGDPASAIMTATEAIEYALRVHDPVTLMQARTTLCLAYLVNGDWGPAGKEIARAQRYRRNERSLIVLALQGLVEKQRQDDAEAETHFHELYEQAARRVASDGRDFGAWDLQCFALCGLESGPDDIGKAVAAFRTARELTTSPTPGLVSRLRFLLAQLDQCDRRPGRLQAVIEACGEGSGRGWRI